MRTLTSILALFLCSVSAHAASDRKETPVEPPIGGNNGQLLLVRSASWSAASGTLERFERTKRSEWRAVGAPVAVALGRRGMAWGRGLHPAPERGPQKREGDGKSPAGVFALGTAFGAADALPGGAHGFPYLHVEDSSYCVEDTRSAHYNQLVDSREVRPQGWEKWSELARRDGLFDWGVVVKHNAPDVRKGAGSCVFLHIWRGPRRPTSGCTAMALTELEGILGWLDPGRRPLLVQLPEPVFESVRSEWRLP